jgi:hypothetical protein
MIKNQKNAIALKGTLMMNKKDVQNASFIVKYANQKIFVMNAIVLKLVKAILQDKLLNAIVQVLIIVISVEKKSVFGIIRKKIHNANGA